MTGLETGLDLSPGTVSNGKAGTVAAKPLPVLAGVTGTKPRILSSGAAIAFCCFAKARDALLTFFLRAELMDASHFLQFSSDQWVQTSQGVAREQKRPLVCMQDRQS